MIGGAPGTSVGTGGGASYAVATRTTARPAHCAVATASMVQTEVRQTKATLTPFRSTTVGRRAAWRFFPPPPYAIPALSNTSIVRSNPFTPRYMLGLLARFITLKSAFTYAPI